MERNVLYMEEMYLNQEILSNVRQHVKETSNVCIYVDYDNIYWTTKQHGIDITSDRYNICEMFSEIYGMHKIRDYRVYADFDKLNINLRNIQLQRAKICNVLGNNREDKHRKNASDIQLSIDIVEDLYTNSNSIDTYVIVTSDSDMIPIINKLKYHGKTVHLYYIKMYSSRNMPLNIYCDFSCDITELLDIRSMKDEQKRLFDTIIQMVIDFYKDTRNEGKTYGFAWLKRNIVETCNVSEDYACELINIMFANNMLYKDLSTGYAAIMPTGYVI